MLIKLFSFSLLYFLSTTLFAGDTIFIGVQRYLIDHDKNLIVCNQKVTEINSQWPDQKGHIFLDNYYTFANAVSEIQIGTAYPVIISNNNYTLYFTQLPLLSIDVNQEIPDEPKVPAFMTLSETNDNITQSHIGIEVRGGWSQTLPKQSFQIEIWKDELGMDTEDLSLLNMRSDDDWNLQAMYNEPLRIRNKSGHAIWKTIHQVSYADLEPEAINGITMRYVECSIDGEYRGVYAIGERVDRKQLKLKKYDGEIRGTLYKGVSWGSTTFDELPDLDNSAATWGAFRYDYPEESINWQALYDFADLVINASDSDFFNEYPNNFEPDNAVDYFLFLNLLRATDNTGKNIYIARYDSDSRFFYVPWDLDGIFGIIWDGSNGNYPTGILKNGFYERLIYNCHNTTFTDQLKERWTSLRATVLNYESLISIISPNYNYLLNNGVYERESIAWPDFSYGISRWTYLKTFLANRLTHLDEAFAELCTTTDTVNPLEEEYSFLVYPNPVKEICRIRSIKDNPDYEVRIHSLEGQLLLQREVTNGKMTFSVASWADGLYTVTCTSDTFTETHKLLILR